MARVTIYGRPGCPHTDAARRFYGDEAEYIDVRKDEAALQRMLVLSKRRRAVPVIVNGEQVSVGFRGQF